jgi:hypothetical protein
MSGTENTVPSLLISQTGRVDLQVNISVFDAESSCMSMYRCHRDGSDALSASRFV